MTTTLDRAAAVRDALCRVVAARGFHGASMSTVAREAGVATGTAYVHYESKDELVLATYLAVKDDLGRAAVEGVDPTASARERFGRMWRNVHAHLALAPDRARFLVQVDSSPYAAEAHERALARLDDPLVEAAAAPDLAAALRPLPFLALYDVAIGPAVRAVARGDDLDEATVDALVEACWRAATV